MTRGTPSPHILCVCLFFFLPLLYIRHIPFVVCRERLDTTPARGQTARDRWCCATGSPGVSDCTRAPALAGDEYGHGMAAGAEAPRADSLAMFGGTPSSVDLKPNYRSRQILTRHGNNHR